MHLTTRGLDRASASSRSPALGGLRRGLIASGLSLAGLAGGAYFGSRYRPHLLHGGAVSAWTPIAALAGAVVGALLLQAVACSSAPSSAAG